MRQVREIRYRTIADELRRQIAMGELANGAVLPSEAELAGSYDVSRVTVRKALELLREDGLVSSRQGYGWFVAGDTVRQSLGTLSTIETQLTEQGRVPVRRVVSFGFAPGGDGDELVVTRVNLADGRPFACLLYTSPSPRDS